MTLLACLPLDDRPVNYDYLRELGVLAGLEIDLPGRENLGNPWRASRHEELIHWLEKASQRADALLIAVDTLGYGGLIPSRTSTETAEEVLDRLAILRTFKAKKPELVILAYSVILRISRADSAEEEKEYWGQYGKRMFRLSCLEHKSMLGESSQEEKDEYILLRPQIPAAVYEDYLMGRARNHLVNKTMLDWLEEGVFDYLILPQDDTADYGWNIAEARRLQALIRTKGLSDRAITYPGADETGSLLLARYACSLAGFAPRVWPRYSSQSSGGVITSYEDRPMHELLKAHLAPLGGYIAGSPQEADLQLFINAPAKGQGVADLQTLIAEDMDDPSRLSDHSNDEYYRRTLLEMTTPERNIEEFIRAMGDALKSSSTVALADVAFVNGADLFLLKELMESGLALRLAAYAGWNTAGNTLGTVLAQAVLKHLLNQKAGSRAFQEAQTAFLFRRYLDDYFYQTVIRSQLAYHELPASGLAPSMERLPDAYVPGVEEKVRKLLTAAARELKEQFVQAGLASDVRVEHIYLPWRRLFEVGFDVQVESI